MDELLENVNRAAVKAAEAHEIRDAAILAAHADGYSAGDIATFALLTKGRVSQIVAGANRKRRKLDERRALEISVYRELRRLAARLVEGAR